MGVNKVEYYGETLIDTTGTTVSEDTLMEGVTAINAAGEEITGNLRAVEYKEQNPTVEEQAQARANIDALGTEDLPEAINTALAQAKESGEFNGQDGEDGQDGQDGEDGSDGVGITTLVQVTASEEDGGENVWRATLSDNQTADFKVKNGNKGKTAYEYAQDGGFTGTEEDFIDSLNTIDDKADIKHDHTWDEVGVIHYERGSNIITSDDVIYNGYHKVCDTVPTLEEVQKGGMISYYENGELLTANFLEGYFAVISRTDSIIIAYDGYPFVIIVLEDRITYMGNRLKKGIHFCQDSIFCVHSLTINNYTGFPYAESQKIPNDRLPEDIGAVKTVNGVEPDENGNIDIDFVGDSRLQNILLNYVKTVNNIKPDSNGNVNVTGEDGSLLHTHTWSDLAATFEDLTIASDDVNYGDYRKVSDEVPTLEDINKGGKVSFNEGGTGIVTMNYPEGEMAILERTNGAVIAYNGMVLVVIAFEDGMSYMGNTFEKGITFAQNDTVITHSFTLTDYVQSDEINPIPVEYMPESHQFGETTVTLVDNQTVTFTSDGEGELEGFTIEENGVYTVIYNGTEYADLVASAIDGGDGVAYGIGNVEAFDGNDNGIPFILISMGGITAVIDVAAGSESCTITITDSRIKHLDNKFLEPFEIITVGKDTLTWDGKPSEYYHEGSVGTLYFVSSATPTMEDLANGVTLSSVANGQIETESLTSDQVYDHGSVIVLAAGMAVIVLDETKPTNWGSFEKKGVYFIKTTDGAIVTSLTINGYTGFTEEQAKLKPECMPYGGVMLVNFSYTGMEQSASGMTLTGASADRTYEDVKAFIGNGGMAFGVITVQGATMYVPLYAFFTLNGKNAIEFMIRPIGQYSGTTAEALIYEDGTVTLALNAS